ncbi:MAG TPA: nuclear transport factor 2 family protein [Alphaproteobacteria bacterium]|nr:nuclear transport factor 2 family protein [Alphaproteobacteria bacterium]
MVSDLERLEAIEAIHQLKARYFRFMDTKDWAGLETIFTDDCVFDMRSEARDKSRAAEGLVIGAKAIAAAMRHAVQDLVTVHHGHMPEIEVTSPSTATGIWAMEDVLRWPEGAPMKTLRGYGHYHETYERVGGRWLIKALRLSRLRVDVT